MAKYSSYDTFISAHVGKAMDYDGTAGAQCVDLIKYYLKEVFDISPGAWGDAHCYYDNYNNLPLLKANFKRIANTSSFVPKKGDIMVWSSKLSSGGWGHIAICTGEGDTTYFYSYDQNWTGKHDACKKIKHTYSYVLGVLRPKDQSKVTGKTIAAAFKTGNVILTTNVKVRAGAGTSYSWKKRSSLTANDKKKSLNQTYATMKSGSSINITQVKKVSNKEYWGKFSSGWVCLMNKGTKYAKQ